MVEARFGGTRAEIERSTYTGDSPNPNDLPGILVQVSQPLGNGSAAVCDDAPPFQGGVPATDPPEIDLVPEVIDALNDLGCRFKDGTGARLGRDPDDACTAAPDGTFGVIDGRSTIQFCGLISEPTSFPPGDTLITVRVRDIDNNISAPAQIILRVD